MFWFDIAPVGSSSIESHRKSKQMDDFIPFGLFDAKGFGMNFDSCVYLANSQFLRRSLPSFLVGGTYQSGSYCVYAALLETSEVSRA